MLNVTKQTASAALKGVTMAALLSGALATNATAENAKIKSASFSMQPAYQHDEIVVTSSDGKKWDKIDAKALKLSATMHVDTKHPGYVKQVGILLGNCNNTGCANNPVMFYRATSTRDYHANKTLTFPGNRIPLSTNGIAVPGYGDEIIKSCNSQLQADGATKSYSFNKLMIASFSANTRKAYGKLMKPEVQNNDNGYPDYNGGDVTRQAQFTVKVTCKPYVAPPMVLKNATFMAYTHGSTGCPRKATVEAQFYTDRAGKIEFMLFRDDGAKQKISVMTSKKDSGKYHVYWSKNYNFAKSVDRKYMIVALGHKYSSSWKPIVVKCGAQNDAPGAGGKADVPNPTHGKPNDRPLVVVPPAAPKRPAVIVTPKPPKKPLIKVAPLRKTVCIGGKVSRNSCFCPARTKRVKIGANAYRCLINVVKPQRVVPKVPARRVIKTAPVRRVAPAMRVAPVRKAAPARTQFRFGKRR